MIASVCRICLCSNPRKDLAQLKSNENNNLSGEFIVLFCLGIQINQHSEKSTKFCLKCFTKLVEYHEFKSLALRNESVLRSLGIKVFLNNYIKNEVVSLGSDTEYHDESPIEFIEAQGVKQEDHASPAPSNQVQECNQKCQDEPFIECPIQAQECHDEHLFKFPVKNDCKLKQSVDELLSIKRDYGTASIEENVATKTKISRKFKSCNECGRTFTNSYNLACHEETHKPREERANVECAFCNKSLLSKRVLQQHIMIKHSTELGITTEDIKRVGRKVKKKHKCQLCNKHFITEKIMESHMKNSHLGIKAQCPVCKKSFTEEYLKNHIRLKHEPDSLPFKCEVCSRRFLNARFLQRHVTVHTNDKPFGCDICGAMFRLKYSVGLHKQQVHEKSRNHVCHICSKRYFTNSRLQRHLRSHAQIIVSGELRQVKNDKVKEVTCPDCGKPLANEKSLTQHRQLHTGQKNYNCSLCDLSFATKKYANHHMKTHTQVRKFGCKYCPATFVRSGGRRRHELESHLQAGQKKPPRKYRRKPKKNPVQDRDIPPEPSGEEVEVNLQPVSVVGPIKTEINDLQFQLTKDTLD